MSPQASGRVTQLIDHTGCSTRLCGFHRGLRIAVVSFIASLLPVHPALGDTMGERTPQATLPLPARHPLLRSGTHAWQWSLHMDAEGVVNLRGGIRRGAAYDNVLQLAFASDTRSLGLWEGGRLALSMADIRSNRPSGHYIGDTQSVSNLEAAPATRLYQLWYRQRWERPQITLRAGIFDLNMEMDTTDSAALLLNASFGITPTIAVSVPTSTYPRPGTGAMLDLDLGSWDLHGAVFQGDPADRDAIFGNGYMALAEVARQQGAGVLWKVGGWHYEPPSGLQAVSQDTGVYGSLEWSLTSLGYPWQLFLQVGVNPGSENTVPRYLGLGFLTAGFWPGRPNDLFSAGIAHADLQPGTAETTLELTYILRLTSHLFLQPDLQFVRNPGGNETPNALVGLLRLHIEFY